MEVRLIDFKAYNDDDVEIEGVDSQTFKIQMFGINEKGESFSIKVNDFKPYFFCMVHDSFSKSDKNVFFEHIKQRVGNYYAESILSCSLIHKKKLDGFDGRKHHNFLCFKFRGMPSFYKVRNLWYKEMPDKKKVLIPGGYTYRGNSYKLYEANIQPLLRFFHIKEISPSGWIKILNPTPDASTTTCTYEYVVSCKQIVPLPDKESMPPYKICSFDIEASSSHGDFPVPIKDYKKLAENIVELKGTAKSFDLLETCIFAAFGYGTIYGVDLVYPKKSISKEKLSKIIQDHLSTPIEVVQDVKEVEVLEPIFNQPTTNDDSSDEEEIDDVAQGIHIISVLNEEKPSLLLVKTWLNDHFPPLEGDKVTFIGSTFINYGEHVPYLNHCIVLNGCTPVDNVQIETYDHEKDVLIAWTNLIQRQQPDIMIGYNIYGFDEKFMFKRALETNCVYEFLQLTRNKGVLSGEFKHDKWSIQEKTVILASGEYNLEYFNIEGRLQFDLYNIFRRDYNFESYKLDAVSSYFIGDCVSKIENDVNKTRVYTKNMYGLELYNYIVFEEISHSSNYYRNGQKFNVIEIHSDYFVVDTIARPNMDCEVKWGIAKDDVDHHQIFKLSNGSDSDRAIVAKYCIQDCRLVIHLLNKTDILNGFIQMSNVCSVPIEYLTMRGQGIKLQSYIASQCRKRDTLMPVLQPPEFDTGYEGAFVLKPKCDLYVDDPVGVCDFKSLYPSSMISEGISSDSLVWVKEYDLEGVLTRETGVKRKDVFIYDNLPDYTYIDIEYDAYQYVRKTPKAKAEKIKCGVVVCRFAQFPDEKPIMPSVLEELLNARSATRKLIKKEKDEFMKNILDKRQMAYKTTANSLYGQCGARTSAFYNKYVAASCTAVGRKLLMCAKSVIENVYDHLDCDTSQGKVNATAEYVYGDTDSVFFKFKLIKDGIQLKGKEALGLTIELAEEAGQLVTSFLKDPHELEYEKTFWPFILLSKKRYVGMLYEHDTESCERKSMGIVLKRRDNAPIVKDVYGGLIDILMKNGNIDSAVDFVKSCFKKLKQNEFSFDKFIITKSLRSGYKNPKQIAHKVLADRMGVRDPGNKPKPGDRIRYAFVEKPKVKGMLQGDRIEDPEYIKKNKLKLDYEHYITNQLIKPLQQVFELVLDNLKDFQPRRAAYEIEIAKIKDLPVEKFEKKRETLRHREIQAILNQ